MRILHSRCGSPNRPPFFITHPACGIGLLAQKTSSDRGWKQSGWQLCKSCVKHRGLLIQNKESEKRLRKPSPTVVWCAEEEAWTCPCQVWAPWPVRTMRMASVLLPDQACVPAQPCPAARLPCRCICLSQAAELLERPHPQPHPSPHSQCLRSALLTSYQNAFPTLDSLSSYYVGQTGAGRVD